jgi:hypothetical protein
MELTTPARCIPQAPASPIATTGRGCDPTAPSTRYRKCAGDCRGGRRPPSIQRAMIPGTGAVGRPGGRPPATKILHASACKNRSAPRQHAKRDHLAAGGGRKGEGSRRPVRFG